jgi:hypothetical protein
MRQRTAAVLSLSLLLALPARAADDGTPGHEFSAIFRYTNPQGDRQIGATIFVDRYTSLQEAHALKDVLASQGQFGLANAIRGRANGRLRLGAVDYPLDLAVFAPTRDGFFVVVVTTRPIRIEESQEGSPSLDYPFGAISFGLDGFGRGQGRLFPRCRLLINEDGTVAAQQFAEGEGKVTDIKKVR